MCCPRTRYEGQQFGQSPSVCAGAGASSCEKEERTGTCDFVFSEAQTKIRKFESQLAEDSNSGFEANSWANWQLGPNRPRNRFNWQLQLLIRIYIYRCIYICTCFLNHSMRIPKYVFLESFWPQAADIFFLF